MFPYGTQEILSTSYSLFLSELCLSAGSLFPGAIWFLETVAFIND